MQDFDEQLERLIAFRIPEEGIHPTWHLKVDWLDRDVLARRVRQRAYLARYGRANVFECDATIPEIEAAVRAISEIVQNENSLTRMTEDS